MKYEEHPILGKREKNRMITICFEGREILAEEGEPIAVALLNAGIKQFRTTRRFHAHRGIYCAIGRCTDCMMIVNGVPNVRTCVTPAEEGTVVEYDKSCKVVSNDD